MNLLNFLFENDVRVISLQVGLFVCCVYFVMYFPRPIHCSSEYISHPKKRCSIVFCCCFFSPPGYIATLFSGAGVVSGTLYRAV